MFIDGLRCYSDSNNFYNFNFGQTCEIIRYPFLNENNLTSKISLFPNPSSSFLYIKSNDEEIFNVQFFTLSGKKLSIENSSSNSYDVSKLKKGIYVIKVHTENSIITKMFVKN